MMDKNAKLKLLLEVIGDVELTNAEKKTLEWLSNWEVETVQNIASIIRKIKFV